MRTPPSRVAATGSQPRCRTGVGGGPLPSVPRSSMSLPYRLTPPSRTPSAAAKAASMTPPFGDGWRCASRRTTRQISPARRGRTAATEIAVSACGEEVRDVVEAGAGPSEPVVAVVSVADHRVERVHRPVAEQARHPADGAPEQRGDHHIRGVLGDGLDDGAADLVLVEVLGVAADERADLLSCRVEVAVLEEPRDAHGFVVEHLAGCADRRRRDGRQPSVRSRVAVTGRP